MSGAFSVTLSSTTAVAAVTRQVPRGASSAARAGAVSSLGAGNGSRRALTDFAYLRTGAPLEAKTHKARWRDTERYEAWKTATIPFVEGAVPLEARAEGHTEASFFESVEHSVQSTLAAVADQVEDANISELLPVAAIKKVLEKRGAESVLTPSEWSALLTAPSDEEKAALMSATAETRKAAMFALQDEIGKVTAELQKRQADAFDSGEVDLGVPVSVSQREELQMRRNRPLWVKFLSLVRKQALLASAVEKGLSHEMRFALQEIQEAKRRLPLPSFVAEQGNGLLEAKEHPSIRLASGADMDGTSGLFMNDGERARTYEEQRGMQLAIRDQLETLPRKKLSPPLQVGAPSVDLENFARVLDENPSMTQEQKKRILERYTDAVHASKRDLAFNFTAEKEAFVDPQPRWGAYDPELVKKEDDLLDAARGAGKYSAEQGNVAMEELFPPSSLGEPDIDPSRNVTLTASEEVAAAMKAYDKSEAAKQAQADKAARDAVRRLVGNDEAAARSILGDKAAAAAAGASNKKLEKGGGAAAGALPKGVSAPAGMASDEAAEIVKTFFSRYMAGERMPPPPKPVAGEFKGVPPSANPAKAAAAAAPAAGKGKKKK